MTIETAKAIKAVSEKVNDLGQRLDAFFVRRTDENKAAASDAQNGTCDLSVELDERISDLENALCELSGM